jgi:hypothetical protein
MDAFRKSTHTLYVNDSTWESDPTDFIVFTAVRDNSDYTALVAAAVPARYWKWDGSDRLSEMDAGEKAAQDAVIAANQEAFQATVRARAAGNVDDPDILGMEIRSLIALFNMRDNYLTNRITELQDAMAAMKNSTGAVGNLRAAIPANFLPTTTRDRDAAIQEYKDNITSGSQDS